MLRMHNARLLIAAMQHSHMLAQATVARFDAIPGVGAPGACLPLKR
jgi:hypothetical protein